MGFVALIFNNNKSDLKPFSRKNTASTKPKRENEQSERGVLKQKEAMDENEFRRVLNLFPIVRSRDYHAESELSRESTSRAATDDVSEWQDAWGEEDKKETESQGVDQDDPFWEKLKLAAERKVGAAEAEKFCRAFQTVHKKLVCEELRKDASPSYKNLSSLD